MAVDAVLLVDLVISELVLVVVVVLVVSAV